MPITGLTTQHELGRGMDRIGVFHKGAPRTPEEIERKKPGRDLDFLRLELDEKYAYLQPKFAELYGAQPKEIRGAYLMANTADAAFSAWLEEWGKSGLFHRCDGVAQIAWFDPNLGQVNRTPSACVQSTAGCACKQVGRLNFLLPEFILASGAFGYFTLVTHSVRDIKHIFNLLSDIEAMNDKLIGVPFTLSRRVETVEVPKLKNGKPTGERMTIPKSLIHVQVDETYTQRRLAPKLLGLPMLGETQPDALPMPNISNALPAPTKPRWTEAEAQEWVNHQMRQNDLSQSDLLNALGVKKFGEWNGTVADAQRALDEFLDYELGLGEGKS